MRLFEKNEKRLKHALRYVEQLSPGEMRRGTFRCAACGTAGPAFSGHASNYAVCQIDVEWKKHADLDGKKVCSNCSADLTAEWMDDFGRATLYLDVRRKMVTNWDGSLGFRSVEVHRGHHNIASLRYDAWFVDGSGCYWHGVNCGDSSIIHCRRLKRRPRWLGNGQPVAAPPTMYGYQPEP